MEIDVELADRVMRLVVSPDYRPLKPKQIAAELRLDGDGYREVRRVVKQLVREGRLIYGGNHLVMSTGSVGGPADLLRGVFRRAMGNEFGFVRPNHTGALDSDLPDDVFIPPGDTGGAFEGDLVEVRVRPSRRGGNEGRIVKIVERSRRQFTATFRAVDGRPAAWIDGTHLQHPVTIGDDRGLSLAAGDKVFVELVRFPDADGIGGEAVVLERLGSGQNPAIDTLTVMRQFGLPEAFPEATLDDARRVADAFTPDELPTGRVDLTDLLTVTIDPADARDFDDAISLRREPDGWRLWVHVADVSHFVSAGSELDAEALRRGTSVYLPDRVIPMIPEIISNHLASLQPDKNRFTKTVEIEFNEGLTVTSMRVINAVIRSDLRLNYDAVDHFLSSPETYASKWGGPICDLLGDMHQLAMRLRKQRFGRGSLSMDLPDIQLDLDRSGKVKGARRVEHTESHQIIEEFMLAANQAVATWLDDADFHFLRRIHPPPERRKLRQLTLFARDVGIQVDSMESRFEIQRVLDRVAGTPLEDAMNFAVLRSMSKAVYAPQQDGHYALDMAHYCHFTSPIRRYPDLTVHRLVQRVLEDHPTPDDSFPTLVKLGQHCSDAERNAAQAERELIELKLLHFLSRHIGERMRAVICRVFADGIDARCLKLPIDGYVPAASLPSDRYRFERRGQQLVGFREGNRYRLGDELTVRIARVDLQERQLYLDVIENHSSRGKKHAARSPKTYKTKRMKERRDKRKRRNR